MHSQMTQLAEVLQLGHRASLFRDGPTACNLNRHSSSSLWGCRWPMLPYCNQPGPQATVLSLPVLVSLAQLLLSIRVASWIMHAPLLAHHMYCMLCGLQTMTVKHFDMARLWPAFGAYARCVVTAHQLFIMLIPHRVLPSSSLFSFQARMCMHWFAWLGSRPAKMRARPCVAYIMLSSYTLP